MSFFKTDSELYAYAIHGIYAVILASSFTIAAQVFVPFSEIDSWIDISRTYGIFFTYFVLISGWLSYARSVSAKPHRGQWGGIRFVIDLVIVFTIFYFINLTSEESIFLVSFNETFTWVLPFLFMLYFLWDMVRIKEYLEYIKNPSDRITVFKMNYTRFTVTTQYAMLITIQYTIFKLVEQYAYLDSIYLYMIFITTSLAIIFIYRYIKWSVPQFTH